MSDADRYVAAFKGLLDQLDKVLKEAQEEVADYQRCIEHPGGLPDDQRRRLYRRLRSQERDRRLIGRKDQRRDLTALIADPASSSKLIIPELTDRILKEIGTRAGRLLWEAHKDGLVTEPVRLWEYLKCRPPHAEPNDSWAFAVDCLRESHPSAFKSTAGDWPRVVETRKAMELVIRILGTVRSGGGVTTSPHTPHDPHAPYMPASWFRKVFEIKYERLRSAMRDGRIRAIQLNPSKKSYLYSVPDARGIWPDEEIWIPETPAETG